MSFWNGDHPMQWKYTQVEKAIPSWGPSDNKDFSDSTNEDLTEAANLICLVYDYYNNGSLDANIEVRLSRYNEECKHGAQFCKDWFEQVMYWHENDRMPSDEEQEYYCTRWLESMLVSLDFEYDESKNPKKVARKPYKCSNKGHSCAAKRKAPEPPAPEPKKAKVCEPETKFAVTRADFMQFKAYQRCSAYGLPQWFMTDDAKASEIMNKYNELADIYN